jgi:hypothetical protein
LIRWYRLVQLFGPRFCFVEVEGLKLTDALVDKIVKKHQDKASRNSITFTNEEELKLLSIYESQKLELLRPVFRAVCEYGFQKYTSDKRKKHGEKIHASQFTIDFIETDMNGFQGL